MSFAPIRIVSDGRPTGLKVSTADGEALPVKSVQFFQNYDEAPVVTLELVGVPVDVQSAPKEEKARDQSRFDVV